MPRKGINKVIYDGVIAHPPAWMRDFGLNSENKKINYLPDHRHEIDAFLSATTDSVRLVTASKASGVILDHHDLGELEELRESIQLSELLRSISYGRQTDHSAHTLYLFLLGVYFFYRSERFRSAFAKTVSLEPESSETLDHFNLQWTFASLLHDIGYIFQSDQNRQRAIDRMFRASTIMRRLPRQDPKDLALHVREVIRETGWRIGVTDCTDPEEQLDRLRSMPWGTEIGVHVDAFDTFYYHAPQVAGAVDALALEEFAYLVASSGYDGVSPGVVDHAVGSGLFLLSYSTFWSWLAKKVYYRGSFGVFTHSYSIKDIVEACFAVAAHNMIHVHAKNFDKLRFADNPLLYMGVLCDELQKWDRFPAGDEFLANLKSFSEHCTDSENLDVREAKGRFVFTFKSAELAKKVSNGLDRLADWNEFIEVRAHE